ncbi:MAG: tyrosine--tRNA ligase [Deltaproteobacteria bacterium]|nr:MAG: tyrosine--tRNA ligase [Deltaproteobacteria bacterium]
MGKTVIDILEERGFVEQITDTGIREASATQTLKCYVGFDPTARSLHLGHVIPVMGLAHFQRIGHIPIALVGGGTGMIGDPSGKTIERQLLSKDDVEENARRLREQLSKFFAFDGPHAALLLNNAEWLMPLKLVDFLRDIGKHFSVNSMIAKESVRWRLEERGQGISFTEFTYMLLQAYDFYYLHKHHGCAAQAGGKDQWGNITAGIELIRRMSGGNAHGLTFPLLTTASGVKIGKTEGAQGSEMVWLDPQLTPPYRMYQYWINTDDRDVVKFLKLFTFLGLETIGELEEILRQNPGKREPHRVLALEFTKMVHGEEAAKSVREVSEILFGREVHEISPEALDALAVEVPVTRISKDRLQSGMPLVDALIETKLAKSKRAARDLIGQGGAYVNNGAWKDIEARIDLNQALLGRAVLLRSGKKTYHLVMVS